MTKWFIDNLKPLYYEKMTKCIDEGIRSKKIKDAESLSSMIKQQVKRLTNHKTKEADVYMVDNASKRPRGVAPAYATLAARPYQQQGQSTQAPNRAFNYRGRPEPPRPFRRENRKYTPLPMPMANLYAYLLERKLVTLLFLRPKEGPPPGFDLSKKCKHHFRAKGHTFEECYHLRDRVQDLIDNKLIQFDNVTASNIITNPLPPHQEGNVNAIITVEERTDRKSVV